MRKKKILCLLNDDRFDMGNEARITAYFPYYRNNYAFTTRVIGPGFFQKLLIVAKIISSDVVLAHNITSAAFLRWAKLLNHRVILDLDSRVLNDFLHSDNSKKSRKCTKSISRVAKIPKLVVVQGEGQRNLLRKYNRNIKAVPTYLSSEPVPKVERKRSPDSLVIGYIGYGRDVDALKRIEEPLRDISRKHRGLVVKVVAERFIKLDPPIRYYYKKMDPGSFVEDMMEMDICIFPSLSKSHQFFANNPLALIAMSAGIPTVIHRSEIDRNIFRDGEEVMIFKGPHDFREKLSALIGDPSLWKRLNAKGGKRVTEHFLIRENYRKLRKIIEMQK